MVPSSGGCFEVTVGETRVYSKLETGKFPDEEKVIKAVGQVLGV